MRLARLAPSDIDDMRRGRGNYQDRLELRRLLAEIDPTLRTRRNSERMTLANLAARLAQLDTRTGIFRGCRQRSKRAGNAWPCSTRPSSRRSRHGDGNKNGAPCCVAARVIQ
jgi:hypothetical protein